MSGSYCDGPYIPSAHERYDLLPRCRKNGGEVFSYPSWLLDLEDELRSVGLFDGGDPGDGNSLHLVPYGFASYADYQRKLQGYADQCRLMDADLTEAIDELRREIDRLNVKENWSVVRYVGDQLDDLELGSTLTKGRFYYWPCSKECPVYEGVIDDEEFTSYLYPCDPDSWEVLEDPTGMAARALAGEADTVSYWRMDEQEGAPFSDLVERGVVPKLQRGASSYIDEATSWGESERDPVSFNCPQCGEVIDFLPWTKLNRMDAPEAYDLLLRDRLSEFVCPACGYTASLTHPCLLLDPDNNVCVYRVVDDGMAAKAEELFDSLRVEKPFDSACFRIVRTRQELAEKARLAFAGLDDRPMEVLKLGVSGNARMQGFASEDESCEILFRSLGEDGTLEFGIEVGAQRFSSTISEGAYQLFVDLLKKSSLAEEQPYYVDRAWAGKATEVFDSEGL